MVRSKTTGRTSLWDVIIKTIEEMKTPLSAKEIWEKSKELKTIGDFSTNGKTPWLSIAAYCYTDINNNGDSSEIIQTSQRPAQFFLRKLVDGENIEAIQEKKDTENAEKETNKSQSFDERDLHPLVVAYAIGDPHFKARLKTIHHERSSKGTNKQKEWLHPDLVGVYLPFSDYKTETREVQDYLKISAIKIFSFELKINLGFFNLRQAYFQAVSNSSWANEGYLVTLNLDEDPMLLDEIRRLNNAFGIGLIELNAAAVAESKIVFPAKINTEIDWNTVNLLNSENPDFKTFLQLIADDCKLSKEKSQYDPILEPDDLAKYIKDKGIRNAD